MRLTVTGPGPRRPKQTAIDSPSFRPDPDAWQAFIPPTPREWTQFVERARHSGNQTLVNLIEFIDRATAPDREETTAAETQINNVTNKVLTNEIES